jgi:hypothetical protein
MPLSGRGMMKFNAGEEGESEDLAPAGQNLVQRFTEIRSRLSDIPADLLGILLPALLDLLLENFLQVTIPEPVLPFGRVIDDHIRDESTSQPSCLQCRVLRQEWIRGPGSGHSFRRSRGRWCRRGRTYGRLYRTHAEACSYGCGWSCRGGSRRLHGN